MNSAISDTYIPCRFMGGGVRLAAPVTPLAPIQKPAPQNDADHPHLPLERLGLR